MVGEGTDNGRQKTRNHSYDVIVGGELFTDYSECPHRLVTLNPKLKSTGAGRLASFPLVGCLPQALGLKDFSPKSQDAVALQQIKERGALPMIDRGDIRQAIDRCSNIWASLPGAGYGQFEHMSWQPDCKIQRSGRNGQRDWCMTKSPAIISALVICIIVCLSWAVNHYRDNAITYKAQPRQKCQRTEAGERGNYWHADASAWCCYARCKIHEEFADAKSRWCSAWWCCRWSSSVAHQAVCQSVREATTAPAWIMQPPRLADTAERDYFTLRGWSLCKNNWKEPRSILMSSADRVAHIDGQLLIVSNTHALPARYKYKVIKPANPLRMFAGFLFLTTFFLLRHKFWLHRRFLLPKFRNEMMGDGFLWCYCRLFWTVNVCWAHPVINRASGRH